MTSSESILKKYSTELLETVLVKAWGEDSIFYNPDNSLKRGVYVMTVKQKDGENDKASNLDREGVYRINTCVAKSTFIELFGYIPKRPSKGKVIDMDIDFEELDVIMPHPVYAWMGWICVLNPSEQRLDEFDKYIHESYELSKLKFEKRMKNK